MSPEDVAGGLHHRPGTDVHRDAEVSEFDDGGGDTGFTDRQWLTYGGKAGLVRGVVRELCKRALAGEGPVPAEARSNALQSATDPHAVIVGWGDLTAEVSPRISPLLILLRTAAQTDREADALHAELADARLARMADNAQYLVQGGHLRAGITANDARDVLWLCTAPELYELLVLQRGWTPAKFGAFVADTITGALR